MVPQPRPHIKRMLHPEVAEPPAPGERLLKLNSNEAPFAPSPAVIAAIRALEPERLRGYPSPWADAFREAAARHHGLAPGNVLAGNGSEELLGLLLRGFVPPDGQVAAPARGSPLFSTLCRIHGAKLKSVAWLESWELPGPQLAEAKADAVYVANPNMPSGTAVAADAIGALARQCRCLVIVDEAYADFADDNCLRLLAEHENLVITRTFSYGYALAGLRFGYALAHEEVLGTLMKIKDRYNTSALAQSAAIAALQDQDHAQRMWEHVRQERGRLTLELQFMGFDVPRSQANFVLARHREHTDGALLRDGLERQGVLVRRFEEPELADAIGITVGTSQENDALLGALEAVVGKQRAVIPPE